MKKKSGGLGTALATLEGEGLTDRAQALETIRKGLEAKLVAHVAEAARLAGKFELGELVPDLLAVFRLYLTGKPKADKLCVVKKATVNTLHRLGCQKVEVFLQAARCRAAALPGQRDEATDLRMCAAHALLDVGGLDAAG